MNIPLFFDQTVSSAFSCHAASVAHASMLSWRSTFSIYTPMARARADQPAPTLEKHLGGTAACCAQHLKEQCSEGSGAARRPKGKTNLLSAMCIHHALIHPQSSLLKRRSHAAAAWRSSPSAPPDAPPAPPPARELHAGGGRPLVVRREQPRQFPDAAAATPAAASSALPQQLLHLLEGPALGLRHHLRR